MPLLYASSVRASFLLGGTTYTVTVHDFASGLLGEYTDTQATDEFVADPVHLATMRYDKIEPTVVGDIYSQAYIYSRVGGRYLTFSASHNYFLEVGTFAEQSAAGQWNRINSEASTSIFLQDDVTFSNFGQDGTGSLLMFWKVSGFQTVFAMAQGTEDQPTLGLGYDVHSQILLTMDDVLGTDVLFDEPLRVTGPPSLHPANNGENKGYENEVVVGSATFEWNQPTSVDVELHTFSDIIITSIDASQSFQASTLQDFGDTFDLQRIELRNSAGELVTEFNFESDLGIDYLHFATVPEPGTLVLATILLSLAALRRVRVQNYKTVQNGVRS